MTNEQWKKIEASLRHWWPGEFSEAASEGYRLLLDGEDPSDIGKALATWVQSREKFRPSASDIRGLLYPMPTFASSEAAWGLVVRAICKVRFSWTDPRFAESHQAAIDWLREQDAAVAAWAAGRGLCGPGSLGMEATEHPQYGGAALKRLGDDYGDVVQRAEDRVARGQLPFEERQFLLPAGRSSSGPIQDLLDHCRPVSALPAGEMTT